MKDELEVHVQRHAAVVEALTSEAWARSLLEQIAQHKPATATKGNSSDSSSGSTSSKESLVQEAVRATIQSALERADKEARAAQLLPNVPMPDTPVLHEARQLMQMQFKSAGTGSSSSASTAPVAAPAPAPVAAPAPAPAPAPVPSLGQQPALRSKII